MDASTAWIRTNFWLERDLDSRNGKVQPDPLLPLVARGDAGAVKDCIDRYGSLVWSIVRKSIRDYSLAEDAVQEIFVALWKGSGRFDPSLGSESLFITTIARRRLIDRFRSRASKPEPEQLEELVIAERDPELERVDTRDEAQPALAALARLKPEQRKLLELWVLRGMTHSEIATSTGMALGTVKSQIRRGLIRVRELIQATEVQEKTV